MKTFKVIDFWFQISVIVGCIIFSLFVQEYILSCYFVVGTVQVLDMIFHELKNWFTTKGSNRYYYHRLVLVCVSLMALAPVIGFLAFIFYIMIFVAPFMAIYYSVVCYKETRVVKAKELIHLK